MIVVEGIELLSVTLITRCSRYIFGILRLRWLGRLACQLIFFLHNMLGYAELNIDITRNHLALMSYFVNTSFKKRSPFGNPLEFLEKRQCFHSNDRVRCVVQTSCIHSL